MSAGRAAGAPLQAAAAAARAGAGVQPAEVPPGQRLFLALDLGTKRSGMASGNRLTRSASPLPSIRASGDALVQAVLQRVRQWQPDALVVGIPFHPDGAAHEHTVRARRLAQSLRQRTGLAVYEVDERYSTTEALALGAADADAAAACIILEQFLRSLP